MMSTWKRGRVWGGVLASIVIVGVVMMLARPVNAAITGTISAVNGAVTLPLPAGVQTAILVVSGTWTGTLVPEGSIDSGVTWFTVLMFTYPSAAAVTSTTANGQWALSTSGLDQIRLRASAWTSGTATVSIATSTGVQTLSFPTAAAGSSNVNLSAVGGTSLTGAQVADTTNNAFRVNCVVGCAGSSFADNSAFTAGSTTIANIGGVFNDALAAVTSGNAAAARITAQRGVHVNLRNASGTELATAAAPLRIDPTGTTTQPVSGTVTANAGTGTFTISGTVTANAGTNLNTSALALDTSVNGLLRAQGSTTAGQTGPLIQGAVTTAAPTYTTGQTNPLSLTTSGLLRVDGSGVTQPISGTVTANAGIGTFTTNVAQFGGSAVVTGTGPSGAGIPRVTLSNDSSLAANQSVNLTQVGGAAIALGSTTMSASLPTAPSSDHLQCTSFVAINQTASTDLITPGAGNRIYICSIMVVSATAQSVSVVEGTGTTCATGLTAIIGGTTASLALAANGGFSMVSPTAFVRTATATDHLCVLQSGTGNVSGIISYRAAP